MNALPVSAPMTPKIHIHVDMIKTNNDGHEHHHLDIDLSTNKDMIRCEILEVLIKAAKMIKAK
jgi:hypothetical protein